MPAQFQYTVPPAGSAIPLDMYYFITNAIRQADEQYGNQFLYRYLRGPQTMWEATMAAARSIPMLWSVRDCPDDQLPHLQAIVGWTKPLARVTDRLSMPLLRRLIATSVRMWKLRGDDGAMRDVLTLLTAARCRSWDWFDFRWVLDVTQIGEEHKGRDPWVINLPGPPTLDEMRSNLRIVDDGDLDRQLVRDIVDLMRASGERWEITYLLFLDLFTIEGDQTQWFDEFSLTLDVTQGRLRMLDPVFSERTFAVVEGALAWSQYVYTARVRGSSNALGQRWGITAYGGGAATNHYAALVDDVGQTFRLVRVSSGLATDLVVVDLVALSFPMYADTWYAIRMTLVAEAGITRITCHVDGVQLINTTDAIYSQGTVGLSHDNGAQIECDEVEVFSVPADTETVDINPAR